MSVDHAVGQGRAVSSEAVGAHRRGHVAADLDGYRQTRWHRISWTALKRIGKLVSAVGRQWDLGEVAGEVHRVAATTKRVAAQNIDRGAHLPARFHLAIGAEPGLAETGVHHAELVE